MILYSDKASVSRVNNEHATTGHGETQFARAMHHPAMRGSQLGKGARGTCSSGTSEPAG